jgi:hypothetical protein
MRLLQLEAGDHLTITKDLFPDEIPPYAILSHTWGADEEEVTLHDIQNKQGTDKSGHLKIVFCGEQARRDGLQYFWVDTCCIDKSSSAELNEAINSMYRWYQKAEKCYVYLPDVDGDDLTQWSCRLSFRKSRWFTRGWTLQELIAPASVEFFSSSKTCLGDKKSLVQELHDITHVPTRVLREAEEDMLSEFDLEERISWSAHRGTKRPEDKAYSLLGICGLSMPMIYGEREKEAFSRLRKEFADRHPQSDPQAQARLDQCLAELRVTDPQDDKTRIEDAKGGLLKGAYRWVLNHPDLRRLRDDPHCHLLWIKGDAGKGKTMLLCGIINELQSLSSGGHLVYFFCQATDARLNSATAVLRSLVYMLSKRNVTVAKHVQKEYDDAGANVFDGPNVWYTLSRIFGDMLKDPALKPVTFVIDALDECQHDMPKLLELINKNSTTGQIKWIVSSRNEPDIEQRLHIQNSRTRLSLELKENADMVAQAVEAYIKNQVAALAERWSDPALQEHALQTLRDKAERTFLWAALVVQELRNVDEWDVEAVLDDVPPGLDELYGRMLQQIAQLSRENPRYCRQILATVSATYRPLTLAELGLLSGLPPGIVKNSENVRKIANMCGSFLTIRDDAVYFVHQSAKDYLVKDASGKLFRSGIAGIHRDIYLNSMDEMKKSLRRDMYDARHPGTSIHEMKCPDPNPLRTIRYSCVYWIDHLSDAGTTEGIQTGGVVQRFLEQKCLYWLEALALLGGLSHNIISISKLAELIKVVLTIAIRTQ